MKPMYSRVFIEPSIKCTTAPEKAYFTDEACPEASVVGIVSIKDPSHSLINTMGTHCDHCDHRCCLQLPPLGRLLRRQLMCTHARSSIAPGPNFCDSVSNHSRQKLKCQGTGRDD